MGVLFSFWDGEGEAWRGLLGDVLGGEPWEGGVVETLAATSKS